MHILPRIKKILGTEPNETQIDKYLAEVRESLATSNKQFLNLSILVITALSTYQLVIYEGAASLALNSVHIENTVLFRRVFLVVPAALLCAAACTGYLRRCQREVYDYLAISRHQVLGEVGLHELRLPSDFLLGLSLLRNEGGMPGSVIASVISFLIMVVFSLAPAAYIFREVLANIALFGWHDFLNLFASFIALTLCTCSLAVILLAMRIKTD